MKIKTIGLPEAACWARSPEGDGWLIREADGSLHGVSGNEISSDGKFPVWAPEGFEPAGPWRPWADVAAELAAYEAEQILATT